MKVDTKPFGRIEVDERQRLTFPHGLFGFEALRDFVLLDSNQAPFYWLQSIEEPGVAFVLIEPSVFRPDYVLEIPQHEREDIGLNDDDDSEAALVFAIVTIPEDQARMTANLQGPIVVNKKTKLGRQSISTNAKWLVRHYILDELEAVRSRAC